MQIKIDVKNKIAELVNKDDIIICGNSDYMIAFSFDSEWDAYDAKTAIFSYLRDGIKKQMTVTFNGSVCEVPVLVNIKSVEIGVSAGELHTTTPCLVKCEKSAQCGAGIKQAEIIAVQPNLAENDENSPAYVRNRTHWVEEVEQNSIELPNIEHDYDLPFTSTGRKVGLKIGQEYTCEIHLANGGIQTGILTAEEVPPAELGGLEGVPTLKHPLAQFIDGIYIDVVTGTIVYGDNSYYAIADSMISKIVILDVPHIGKIYHKIPKEFIEVLHQYDPTDSAPISSVGVEKAFNKCIVPYLDKSIRVGAYEHIISQPVTSVELSSLQLDDRVLMMGCNKLLIAVFVPEDSNTYYADIEVSVQSGNASLWSSIMPYRSIPIRGNLVNAYIVWEKMPNDPYFVSTWSPSECLSYDTGNVSMCHNMFMSSISKNAPATKLRIQASTSKLPVGTRITVYGLYEGGQL